jgi:hypothetical protein
MGFGGGGGGGITLFVGVGLLVLLLLRLHECCVILPAPLDLALLNGGTDGRQRAKK